jgi:hypothetical protein
MGGCKEEIGGLKDTVFDWRYFREAGASLDKEFMMKMSVGSCKC